ncbi:hypothetical protein K449DRAFT_383347 [Hypoxylon sp. EC38]|nr:hypothetical protein K449DRAFT_383347 [Hypoxylon sp. EC38]
MSHEKKSNPKTVYTAPKKAPPDQKSGPDKDAAIPPQQPIRRSWRQKLSYQRN